MAGLYEILLDGWREVGGGPFNAFVDVAGPSKWGSWGALRHLDDVNPRWDGARGVQPRDPCLVGGAAGDGLRERRHPPRLGRSRRACTAPPYADTLLGGPGDDVLIGGGGGDRLHGGAGTDMALLPGAPRRLPFDARRRRSILAVGPEGAVRLVVVETLRFTDDAAASVAIEALP